MKTKDLTKKYRPQRLENIAGQTSVVREIKGLFDAQQIHSTILLSGPSGVGKTTLARLIGKYLNCKTNNACGKCSACRSETDITEINASNNRGIDDIRSLIEFSKLRPFFNYKVIIVDECHNLTDHAIQAWLKPLEEPGDSTIWILCTTNPEKLPVTVLSRCHKFTLSLLSSLEIKRQLAKIAKREKVEIDKKVYSAIADVAEGRMRDAIHLLESAINISDEKITLEALTKSSFFLEKTELDEKTAGLIYWLFSGSKKKALKEIRTVKDVRGFLHKLIYIVQYLIDQRLDIRQKYVPYSVRLLEKQKDIEIDLDGLLLLQQHLLESDKAFSFDDNIYLTVSLSNFIDTVFEI